MKQYSFFPMLNHIGKVFAPQKGRRKEKRPLSSKHAIHLILHARGGDLKRMERRIGLNWQRFGVKFGIKTYRLVVCRTHVHAIIRLQNLDAFTKFARALTGTLTRVYRIWWLNRPATRITNWGKDFKGLCEYLHLNLLEAEGFLDYQPLRTRQLPHFVRL